MRPFAGPIGICQISHTRAASFPCLQGLPGLIFEIILNTAQGECCVQLPLLSTIIRKTYRMYSCSFVIADVT